MRCLPAPPCRRPLADRSAILKSPAAIFLRTAIEIPQTAPTYTALIATELLATDVLEVVMAPTMRARREKSSAGFHFWG
jgi:hypothetical protein